MPAMKIFILTHPLVHIGMEDCHSVSVVDIEKLSLLVELQFKIVGQLNVVAVALFVDFDNRGTSEMGLHVVGDSSRHEVGGNGAVVAVHLVPCSILVKLQFGAVVQANLIGGLSEVPVDLCVGDGLSWEGFLDERLCSGGKLRCGDDHVIGKGCHGVHHHAHQCGEEKY